MDIQEATKRVMSSIQRLDPENSTRIMGYIMIQEQGDKEMIRLAFFSDTALLSYINQAKARLGIIASNSGSGGNPFSQPATSPRILIPNSGLHLANPSSPFSRNSPRQPPLSYPSALNGSSPSGGQVGNFYGGGSEFRGDFLVGENGVGHVPYFEDSVVDSIMSPSGRSDSLLFPYGGGGLDAGNNIVVPPFHRRSCSVNDAAFFEDNAGGFDISKPCMYFARGNCRNGSSCKFSHSEFLGEGFEADSQSKNGSGFDDLLRIKALQQRFALMGSSVGRLNPFSSHNRCMNFLEGNPRNEFSHSGFGNVLSSSARQIYLTFPADSTFNEDDVTHYFGMFGPVIDVRIPYQHKRMFGFVTFVYPETVKLILTKGNPHFVCDSRVLVKPYKEKGKIPDKKHFHRQPWDKSDFLAGFDSRELYDLPVGPRMLISQEMAMRRKFEHEAELHQKMMNLQLMDLNNQQQQHNYHFPRVFTEMNNRNVFAPASDAFAQEVDGGEDASKSLAVAANENSGSEETEHYSNNGGESRLPESSSSSFEHVLPDNPFTSPAKSASLNNGESATETSSNKTASASGNSTVNLCLHAFF